MTEPHGSRHRAPSLIAGMATFVVSILLLTSGWLLERTRTLRRDLLIVAANDLERQIALGRSHAMPVAPRSPRNDARPQPSVPG